MNTEELINLKRSLEVSESDIISIKGDEYAVGNIDRLDFFKDYSKKLGITPQAVCAIFLLKHINSVLKYAKTGKDSGEGIISRINDARNYLMFMAALYKEESKSSKCNIEEEVIQNCDCSDETELI